MVKYTLWNKDYKREFTKFTRELNTYGVGEDLLFPIRLNDKSGGNQETNLATYLIKYKEFEKTDVKITKNQDKEGFLIFIHSNKAINLNIATILTRSQASESSARQDFVPK